MDFNEYYSDRSSIVSNQLLCIGRKPLSEYPKTSLIFHILLRFLN